MPSGPKRRRAAKNKTNGNSSVNELIVPKVEPVDEENALEYSVKIEKGLAVKTEPVPVELVEPVVESPGPMVSLVEPVAESFTEVGLVEQVVESPGVDLVLPVVESPVVGLVDSAVESPVAVVGLDHEPVVESFLPVVGLDHEPLVESAVESPASCGILEGPRALEEVSSVYELVHSNGVAEENGSVQMKNSSDSRVKLTSVELGDIKKTIEEQICIVEQVAVDLHKILANFH